MRYTFYASVSNTIFERKVFSIFDVFAAVGGMYKSLTIVGFLFCAAFSYDLLISSLIRKLFHFKPRFEEEFPKVKNHKYRKDSQGVVRKRLLMSQT